MIALLPLNFETPETRRNGGKGGRRNRVILSLPKREIAIATHLQAQKRFSRECT
jgi:hypothetical protein